MTGSLKTYPFFMGWIQRIQKGKKLIKPCFIVFKRKGVSDNRPILIHDEAVMFEFGDIDADKICHDDTSCK
jgi:hypothetical protein